MNISPLQLYKCLADNTRLQATLLIYSEQELCVCELTEALQVSQPKVSRHLSQLRECGLLTDRREGQWIYYQLNSELPSWALEVIKVTADSNETFYAEAKESLSAMCDRPQSSICC